MSDSPFQLLAEDGTLVEGAVLPPELDTESLVGLYTHMLRQRLLDDLMLTLQRQGRIGFYGPATGQEAAVFGSGQAFAERDWPENHGLIRSWATQEALSPQHLQDRPLRIVLFGVGF